MRIVLNTNFIYVIALVMRINSYWFWFPLLPIYFWNIRYPHINRPINKVYISNNNAETGKLLANDNKNIYFAIYKFSIPVRIKNTCKFSITNKPI